MEYKKQVLILSGFWALCFHDIQRHVHRSILIQNYTLRPKTLVDPGFPVGGGMDSQGGYVSKNLYVKWKNLDP